MNTEEREYSIVCVNSQGEILSGSDEDELTELIAAAFKHVVFRYLPDRSTGLTVQQATEAGLKWVPLDELIKGEDD